MNTKKVVITGGSGDIANAIVNELKNDKNTNFIVLAPNHIELNVTNIKAVNEYFKREKPDILINNAGLLFVDKISNNEIEKHKQIIDVNLTGVFACTGAVLNANPNAKIINIGSSSGIKVRDNWSSYCATKAALIMATACWAEEGVDTICISPGRTLTKMRKSVFPNEAENTLMKPEDFAKIIHYAIYDKYKKGTNLNVNIDNIKELINE